MKKKPAPEQKNSLRTFFLFCAVVSLLIIISLSIKFVSSIKGSVFDPRHNFILGITSPKAMTLYGINPKERVLSILTITTDGKNIIPGEIVGIIPDVIVSTRNTHSLHLREILPSLYFQKSKLTWFDIARLYLLSNNLEEKQEKIMLSNTKNTDFSSNISFNDPEILDEQLSIGIVNATGQVGVGARLEKVIESLGGTVMSVTTSQQPKDHSIIQYSSDPSYTARRIESLIHVPLQKNADLNVSDIMIILGKDALSARLF